MNQRKGRITGKLFHDQSLPNYVAIPGRDRIRNHLINSRTRILLDPLTSDFMKLNIPAPNFYTSIVANRDFSQIPITKKANSVALDETARYEPSCMDLQCLQLYWSIEMKVLRYSDITG